MHGFGNVSKEIVLLFTDSSKAKGQLISKRFWRVVDFLQKTNKNKSTWGIIVVKTNLFVRFLEEIDDPKKTISKLSDL